MTYGKFNVKHQTCYMANALSLVDLNESKVGDIVKLYRYETNEELYFVARKNNRGTNPIVWDYIQDEETFKLYQALGFIPRYEELCLKTLYENWSFLPANMYKVVYNKELDVYSCVEDKSMVA